MERRGVGDKFDQQICNRTIDIHKRHNVGIVDGCGKYQFLRDQRQYNGQSHPDGWHIYPLPHPGKRYAGRDSQYMEAEQ